MSYWELFIIVALVGWAVDRSIRNRIDTLEKEMISQYSLLENSLEDIKNTIYKI
jgi:hypothetical protein